MYVYISMTIEQMPPPTRLSRLNTAPNFQSCNTEVVAMINTHVSSVSTATIAVKVHLEIQTFKHPNIQAFKHPSIQTFKQGNIHIGKDSDSGICEYI